MLVGFNTYNAHSDSVLDSVLLRSIWLNGIFIYDTCHKCGNWRCERKTFFIACMHPICCTNLEHKINEHTVVLTVTITSIPVRKRTQILT